MYTSPIAPMSPLPVSLLVGSKILKHEGGTAEYLGARRQPRGHSRGQAWKASFYQVAPEGKFPSDINDRSLAATEGTPRQHCSRSLFATPVRRILLFENMAARSNRMEEKS